MNNNDKTVWDGVILVASYHFLLALVSILGAAAVLVFAIIPNLTSTVSNPQSVFLPIIGSIFGLFLCIWYGLIGSGLIQLKNSARMGAVFLALFGAVGGLFVLLGAGIPVINSLLPDIGAVTGIVVAGLCGYTLMTFFDIVVLIFLFSRRVRSVFYGEPWTPENDSGSIGTLVRTAIFGGPSPMVSQPTQQVMPSPAAPAPIPSVASQPVQRRETPAQPPVDDLDTPGDLFTEPAPRKH
jgi:hypothetical protein